MSQQPNENSSQPNTQLSGSTVPPPLPPTSTSNGTGGGGFNPLILGVVAAVLLISAVGAFVVLNNNGKTTSNPTPLALASSPTAGGSPVVTSSPIAATNTAGSTTVALLPTNTQSQPTATDRPPTQVITGAPKVLGISPAPTNDLVRPHQPIAVSFSQAMDRISAQAALKIEPAVEGDYEWRTGLGGVETMLFTPRGAGFARSTAYKVSIGDGAKNIIAAAVLNPGQQRDFRTVGLPQVIRSGPANNATNVPLDASLSLQFDLQMVPLTTLNQQQDPNGKILIEPPTEGQFLWLGTSNLVFQPKNGLQGGATYRVTVGRQLTDIDGAGLAADYTFSFKTASPRVVYYYPSSTSADDNNPDYYPPTDQSSYSQSGYGGPGTSYSGNVTAAAPVIAVFNQPMDHPSTEAAFSLSPSSAGGFAWGPGVGSSEVMTFTPSVSLTLNTTYTVGIATSAKAVGGGQGLTTAKQWQFRTFPPLQVTNVDFSLGGIRVDFNNPVRPRTIKGNFQVSPGLPYSSTSIYGTGDYGADYFQISSRLDPSTKYSLTLSGDIVDVAGQRLQTPFNQSGTTPASPPATNILGATEKASFNAGQPTSIYVGSVNVKKLNYTLYQLNGAQMSSRIINYSVDNAASDLKPVRSWSQPVAAELNKGKAAKLTLSLDGKADRLPPGFYLFTVNVNPADSLVPVPKDSSGSPLQDRLLIVVSNNALTMKISNGQALVWAVNQNTGKPTAGLPIAFYRPADQNNPQPKQIGGGSTDQDGIFQLQAEEIQSYGGLVAISEGGGDMAAVSSFWNEGLNSSEFVLYRWDLGSKYPYHSNSGKYNAYVYSDRPIYRPNQDVDLKAILRLDNDAVYSLPQGVTAKMFVNDGNNDVYSQTIALSPQGTWEGKVTLGKDAKLGYYVARLQVQDSSAIGSTRQQEYYYNFSVQEYRKPEYEVTVKNDKRDYLNGDTIRSTVTAGYFFGGPVKGAKVTTRVTASDYYFSWSDPDTGDSYDFNDYDALYARRQGSSGNQIAARNFSTDASGKVAFETKADLSQVPVSQLYNIESSITDSSNQEVTSSDLVTVHKGAVYVGLRSDTYIASLNQPFSITIQTVDTAGKKAGNQQVQLTLASRTYENSQEKDEQGVSQYVYKPKDTQIEQLTVGTDGSGKGSHQFTVKNGGEYVVKALVRDAAGNEVSSATYVYASAGDGGSVSWQRDNSNRVTLVNDKKMYNVGDTAKILVTSPYTSATALLTTERGTIRTTRVVRLTNNSTVLEVPLPADSVPNLFVSLTLVNSLADGGEAPTFKQGYVELRLDSALKSLKIALTPDKQQYEPGQPVTYTVKTSDKDGKPVTADLSLAVVDKAIFSLADDTSGDMLTAFYGLRQLSINTSSSLAILRAQNTAYDRYAAPSAQAALASGGGGAKGGGGGEASTTVRTNLQDTAYWQGTVATDASGEAKVSFKLPDNLTTWRTTVRGVGGDTLVGEAQNEILVTKPLLVRPVLPRFLTVGDIAQPGMIIRNSTTSELTVDASLQITGTTFADGTSGMTSSGDNKQQTASQQVRVPAGGETKLEWAVKATDTRSAGFTLIARSQNNGPSDALQVVIPINPFVSGEVTADSGEISSEISRTVFIPFGIDTSIGSLKATVNASLAGSALDGADYTIYYPYDSTEQTVSRFLPLLTIQDTFKDAGQAGPYDKVLSDGMGLWVQRLYALQHQDGGWGMWEEENYSPSYPFLTAYALEGLLTAKSHGYTVDQGVLDRAVKYLRDSLDAKASTKDSPDIYGVGDLNSRAYILSTLLLVDGKDVGRLNQLAESASDQLNTFGRANLVIGLVRAKEMDRAKAALATLTAAAKLQSDTAHWEDDTASRYYYLNMDSDERSTAMAIRAILVVSPEDQLATQAVRWLMQHRSEGSHWSSTQASSQVIRALARYVAVKKELAANYNYTITFNDKPRSSGSFSSSNLTATQQLEVKISDMLVNAGNTILLSRDKQEGAMYYSLSLSYYEPAAGLVARSNGLGVSRAYYPEASNSQVVSTTAASNIVRVRLNLTVPQDSYYVTLEDPLPAGFEALNPDLNTTRSVGSGSDGGCFGPAAQGSRPVDYCRSYDGSQVKDDKVVYFATFLPAGTYQYEYSMRATTPGTYFALPARAYLLYAPSTFGRSDGGQFTISK